jgi:alpha-amylase/alpha-mannosidase (GH57 family)
VHGHFYQPPRENPWLEAIELQDSAYPYHDWNTRISHECYRQNAVSRILDRDKKIVDIVNNYSRMSFNFGPTLMSWLEDKDPDVYKKILEADRLGQKRFSGHGPAMAQPYNHMIMPLCNDQDRYTQALWGIRDFEHRFQRHPEGMWLPETAMDLRTLGILADLNIRFTILAPRQAKRVRRLDGKRWKNVNEHDIDTTQPYLCRLPSGKEITLFFYHGPISHNVAFGGLLHNGESLASRMMQAFPETSEHQPLVHLATDGESFGHHHRHADMALAYCLHHIETKQLARVTIYGEYLDLVKPESEVEVWENTSWSCDHGVERWKNNCGCAANPALSGQQAWRAPLRESLDWLRDHFAYMYDKEMRKFSDDPWKLRDDYIRVIHDRSRKYVERFIKEHARQTLTDQEKVQFLKLLEIQRNSMLMYTSCGWFFDDISGIESTQIMKYAARAMQLCRDVHNEDLEPEFKHRLESAPSSNRPNTNGRLVYEACVAPCCVDLSRVGAHVGLSSVFDKPCNGATDIFCYTLHQENCRRIEAGVQVLITNSATIESKITLQQYCIELAVLYLGDHHVFAVVRKAGEKHDFEALYQAMKTAFKRGDTNEVIQIMNTSFGGVNYSLSDLFKDQQRRILDRLLENTREEISASFTHIYEHNYAIMKMVRNMGTPLPPDLAGPTAFILNRSILKGIRANEVDLQNLRDVMDEIVAFDVQLDKKRLSFEASQRISQWMQQLKNEPGDLKLLEQIGQTLEIIDPLVPEIDLQHAQNLFFEISKTYYLTMKRKVSEHNDQEASCWIALFKQLAGYLDLALS